MCDGRETGNWQSVGPSTIKVTIRSKTPPETPYHPTPRRLQVPDSSRTRRPAAGSLRHTAAGAACSINIHFQPFNTLTFNLTSTCAVLGTWVGFHPGCLSIPTCRNTKTLDYNNNNCQRNMSKKIPITWSLFFHPPPTPPLTQPYTTLTHTQDAPPLFCCALLHANLLLATFRTIAKLPRRLRSSSKLPKIKYAKSPGRQTAGQQKGGPGSFRRRQG